MGRIAVVHAGLAGKGFIHRALMVVMLVVVTYSVTMTGMMQREVQACRGMFLCLSAVHE
jgi:hypothetical protein